MREISLPRHESGSPWLVAHLLSDDPTVDRVIAPVRDLTPHECEALVEAAELIDRLTMSNPYFSVERAHERWMRTLDLCRDAVGRNEQSLETERMIRHDLPSAVSGVLSEFRAFVDHVDRWARTSIGDEARSMVKAQTREEYDGRFEYRLASNLRNTAQHRASVVAVVTSSTEIEPGLVRHDLSVTVAPDVVDSKWQSRVRAEFEALSEPIDLVQLLGELMRSCERIVCRLLLVAAPRAAVATRLVIDTVDEVRIAMDDPGAAASIMHDDLSEQSDGSIHGQLRLTHLRRDRAVNLQEMTGVAESLLR